MRASNGGRIILMDFGAGEFMDRPSEDRRMRGTPLYLAPELFDRGSASVATDVYATGVLLFHLVTKDFPVTGSTIETLAEAHRRGDRRRLRDERPDLPDSFVSVVERALDRDPRRRFRSSGEMYEALGGATAISVDGGASTSTTKQKIAWVVTALAVIALITEVVGLLASRIFEAVLRVDPAFTAGLGDYLTVGRRALIPFVVVWTAAAAAFAVFLGLRPLIWQLLRPIRRRLSELNERLDPLTAAGLIVCIGIAGLIWMPWQFYDVYWSMAGLMLEPHPEALDLSILGFPGRPIHRLHSQVSVAVSFLMGLAVLRWFPRLERRATDPARVRALRWAAAIIAFLVVAMEAVTRPILWDRREVVLFDNRRATVIGTNSKELLLFTPEKGERRYFRVPLDAPNLRRNVDSRVLFQGPEQ
jgi:hypothetical protein